MTRPSSSGEHIPNLGGARAGLRRLLLAVQVLDDVDLTITDRGVQLPAAQPGGPPVNVHAASCLAAVRGAPLDSNRARSRLVQWLRLRRWLAGLATEGAVGVGGLGAGALGRLAESVRPLGLPVGHVLHPGQEWVRLRVLGGALELGLGLAVTGDDGEPEPACPVPGSLWAAAGIDADRLWPAAESHLERMGGLAAQRWRASADHVLRPMGGCDAVTLLGSARLRSELATAAGGLAVAAVPVRSRGWTELSRLDPAFAPAAAAATDASERGFNRPVLITAAEVVLARAGGAPTSWALADPAGDGVLRRGTSLTS